jgi:hypothetical protein
MIKSVAGAVSAFVASGLLGVGAYYYKKRLNAKRARGKAGEALSADDDGKMVSPVSPPDTPGSKTGAPFLPPTAKAEDPRTPTIV